MEIFKNMISWHPLDGLYQYTKKFGFIEQYKKSGTNFFQDSCDDQKITRAKKKMIFHCGRGYDWLYWIFPKDILDLKVYDILIISWFKSRSWSIDMMIKLTVEQFTEQAQKIGKYDPQWTVAKVRAGRKWLQKQMLVSHQ